MTAPILTLPTDPHTIGEALAAMQREYDAELAAVKAKFRARFAELHAAYTRAQRSAA